MIRGLGKSERTGHGSEPSAPAADQSLGIIDAEAGVPHPLAESRDDARQPVGRLYGFYAEKLASVHRTSGAAHAGLNEVERLHLVLPAMLDQARAGASTLLRSLRQTLRGRERWLARWPLASIAGGMSLGLPAEIYLTSLSLAFLNVPDAWAERFLAVGIAVALALVALVAANGEKDSEKSVRHLAYAVAAAMLLGLALLRSSVTPNASWIEESGALLVMAAAAFAFVVWTVFVKRRVGNAVAEHAQWKAWMRLEHDARSAQAQLDLLAERQDGLPAEAQEHRDRAVAELHGIQAAFLVAAADWWTEYQAANPAASPDIRSQLDALRQDLESHMLAAVGDIDDRAAALRGLTGGERERTG